MMHAVLAGAGALGSLVVALCSCSGRVVSGDGGEAGESGGSTAPLKPTKPAASASPEKKCQSYVATWCARSLGCYVKVGRLAQRDLQYNLDQCNERVVAALPCSEVARISTNYDRCVADINAMACAKFDVPQEQLAFVAEPPSCDELLSF
jgi:hypothetical protein